MAAGGYGTEGLNGDAAPKETQGAPSSPYVRKQPAGRGLDASRSAPPRRRPAEGLGIYIHFPFCLHKCAYCDFNSEVADDDLRALYLRTLKAELSRDGPTLHRRTEDISQAAKARVTSIYLGGGTPTVYESRELTEILALVRDIFALDEDAEISCEANPGTVTEASLRELHQAGVNRISIGAQSFNDAELALLGRIHTASEAAQAIQAARAAGFANLSIDLMRALPEQSLAQWEHTLDKALELAPDHLSCYGLSIEPGTPLARQVERGELVPLDDYGAAEMFIFTHEKLTAAGYEHYEISNFAHPGKRCHHNLLYWRNKSYLGFGAGAWSYVDRERFRNIAGPEAYCRMVLEEGELTAESECLEPQAALGEAVMLGLRLAEGVDLAKLGAGFGLDWRQLYDDAVDKAMATSLLEADGERLRPTLRGMLLNNELAALFIYSR